MNYGFVIDNTRCIGCHACSTACKSENEVPLGVYRTWVKYVEHGAYPDVRRTFQVTRCNHCENPPCVRICPVTAMYQRADGIVEFDPDVCIGCKACLQACPYDAIHIDPATKTAAKCHYCAHRVDVGLEPACVVVCPTHAIIAGDLDDPASEIAGVVASRRTVVRKPEQGTAPKLFYVEGDDVALHPTEFPEPPAQMIFADAEAAGGRRPADPHAGSRARDPAPARRASSGTPIRTPGEQGVPAAGPVRSSGRAADHMVQLAYDVSHAVPWHWPVPAYLVTKAIGAGIFLVLGFAWGAGLLPFDSRTMLAGGLLSVLAILATTALLVIDLERPERFLSILLRPQWKSWLARGAFLLVGFATVSGLWWALEAGAHLGWLPALVPPGARPVLAWASFGLAIGAAIYTAFLFAQAEGRDLWQSPLLPFHLLLQAVLMGAGALLALDALLGLDPALAALARPLFAATLVLDLFVTLAGELGIPHASEIAARAAHAIRRGRHARAFWLGAVVIGHAAPLALLAAGGGPLAAVAFLLAVAGLYAYEHAFVMAPQEIPNA